MDASIEMIAAEVERQLSPIRAEVEVLEVKLLEKTATRDKLEAVLLGLREPLNSKPSSTRKREQSSKRCVSKKDAISAIQAVLESNGPTRVEDLKMLAKDSLKANDEMSLSGFALRFEEAQKDMKFVAADGVVSLARLSSASDNANVKTSSIALKR